MTSRQILFASDDEVAHRAGELFAQFDDSIELIIAKDGADCIGQYVRLTKENTKPIVVIIDYNISTVSGGHLATSLRGVERGLGVSAAAIILRCNSENGDSVSELIPELGRAVQLTRKAEYTPEQQLKRLVKASAKVLNQLKGRSRR